MAAASDAKPRRGLDASCFAQLGGGLAAGGAPTSSE